MMTDPLAKGVCRYYDRLSIFFNGGDRREYLLTQDRVGGQDTALSVAEAIKGYFTSCLPDLEDADNTGNQQRNCVNAITFPEDLLSCRNPCKESSLLEVTCKTRVRSLKHRHGIHDAIILLGFDHNITFSAVRFSQEVQQF